MIYLDASVALAYYLPDPMSAAAQALYDRGGGLVLSDWAHLEVASVVARRVRAGDLRRASAAAVLDLMNGHVEADLYRRLATATDDVARARHLVERLDLSLKAADALHLALARGHALRLATGDRQMTRAATELGLEVDLITP